MNTKENKIIDWFALAFRAGWSAKKLAKLHNVSSRTLYRYFIMHFGKSPKHWMAEQRNDYALKLLANGKSIKETAALLNYRNPSNFSRRFKLIWGVCPSRKFQRLFESDCIDCSSKVIDVSK